MWKGQKFRLDIQDANCIFFFDIDGVWLSDTMHTLGHTIYDDGIVESEVDKGKLVT